MSSDARIWHTDEDGWDWVGNHDGPCPAPGVDHMQPDTLLNKMNEIAACYGVPGMRWLMHTSPAGERWLRGWST